MKLTRAAQPDSVTVALIVYVIATMASEAAVTQIISAAVDS